MVCEHLGRILGSGLEHLPLSLSLLRFLCLLGVALVSPTQLLDHLFTLGEYETLTVLPLALRELHQQVHVAPCHQRELAYGLLVLVVAGPLHELARFSIEHQS